MPSCPGCGGEVTQGKRFCRHCGADLVQKKAEYNPRLAAEKEIVETQLVLDPLNCELLCRHAAILRETGDPLSAAKELEKVLALRKDVKAQILLAEVYLNLKQPTLAADQLRQLIALPERTPSYFLSLARIQSLHLRNPDDAASTLQAGLTYYASNLDLLRAYRDLLVDQGRQAELLDTASRILEVEPNDIGTIECMADFALSVGDFEKAYSLFTDLGRKKPSSPRAILYGVLADLERAEPQERVGVKPLLDTLEHLHRTELSKRDANLLDFSRYTCKLFLRQITAQERTDLIELLLSGEPIIDRFRSKLLSGIALLVEENTESLTDAALGEALHILHRETNDAQIARALGTYHSRLGKQLEERRMLRDARDHYARAVELFPAEPQYQESLTHVSKKVIAGRRTLVVVVSILAAIAGGIVVLLYLGVGRISISVNFPADVKVAKGARTLFHSPDARTLETDFVRYGDYLIRVEKPGYDSVEKTISVGFGRKIYAETIRLVPVYGSLRISSSPPAGLFLDGTLIGGTPFRSDSILARPVTVKLERAGYLPWEKSCTIAKGETLQFNNIQLRLTPLESQRLKALAEQREQDRLAAEQEKERALAQERLAAEQEKERALAQEQEKQRVLAREQERQEEQARISQVLLGRWYIINPPCNMAKNIPAWAGSYIEFEKVEPDGSLIGTITCPASKDNSSPFQGTLNGTSFELHSTSIGMRFTWTGTIDLESSGMSGGAKRADGWKLQRNWTARKH